ncbi:uncharacterized protein BP5553_00760 [Venustampulla echinocandica]|uniref:Uncharacterized protein n=1 Tax=Venustampulla echinocandica TaxID=2656787 RepID=A0A370TZ19_9HELO|nr:uncharacterized protein BP5553_00760 [Venustampulla echinocandica]RDL40781.1 hypothetical protein BP5553_00760 [Venustampulla echinocandica]
MRGSLGSLVLAVWSNFLYGEAQQNRFQTVLTTQPTCDQCVPRELIVAPAVGFDLTLTYGTVAIRYHNKTVVSVGRVNGSDDYKAMMNRLAEPYNLKYPPFDNIRDRLQWQYDQAQRRFRQSRGLPSTPDIETLSHFLGQLNRLAEESTPESIPPAVFPSLPEIPNLPFGDFDEALGWVNLTRLRSYKSTPSPVNQFNTAFAGMGYGICTHWSNVEQCDSEEVSQPVRHTLTISYTADEFVVERSTSVTAYWIYRDARDRTPALGSSHRPLHNPDSIKDYWEQVGDRIKLVALAGGDPRSLDTLVLMGESAQNKQLLDTIWKALSELGKVDLYSALQTPQFTTEFVAARGAAEMAKRAQAGPNGCVERELCREQREPGDE